MNAPEHPAGSYEAEPHPTPQRRDELISEIERLPARIRQLVAGLSSAQLDTKYRNWTIRQIVHHLADSHMNALVRFRLTLTEEKPTIKPYNQSRWAELPDAKTADVELSVALLEALHARWVALLRTMGDADFERTYVHPEYQKEFQLAETLGLYAYHCRHHSAQIDWLLNQSFGQS